jgi:hypothetical protein
MSAFSAQLKPTDEQQEIIDVVHTASTPSSRRAPELEKRLS